MANNAVQVPTCVVDGCTADLSNCRKYHQRHKVCEVHSKSPEVSIKGQKLRFCQQCSRFHTLDEFDEGKRSCRKRLDGHNRRRRKPRPYLFPAHHATGVLQLQSGGPPVHRHVWSQSDHVHVHAPSLLSSSEASSCTTLTHPSPGSFSTMLNPLDSGVSYGGLENDSDPGWGGMIDTGPYRHEDPHTLPFYWQY